MTKCKFWRNPSWKGICPMVIASTVLSACSVADQRYDVPIATVDDFYFAADVLHTLECELNDAVNVANSIDPRFNNQSVAVTLTLTVTEVRSLGGTATLVVPVGSSSLSIGSKFTPKTTNVRAMEIKHGYSTSELEPCEKNLSKTEGVDRVPSRLSGGLGLTQWVTELAKLMQTVDEDPTASTYTVSFQINEALEGTPVISVSDDNLGLAGSKGKTVKHQLAVTVKEFDKRTETKRQSEQRAFEIQENLLERLAF